MRSLRALSLSLLVACAGDTGSQRYSFKAYAGGAESASTPFTFENELGWTITLTQAEVTLGPVYLNVISPLRGASLGWLDWIVPLAHAQSADHLDSGRRIGEVLGQLTFNALSAELVPFPVLGTLTEEQVGSTELWFYPPPGVSPDTRRVRDAALQLAGEAARDGSLVRFRGALVLDDAWLLEQPVGTRGSASIIEIRQVRGIPSTFLPRAGGHLELRLDVTRLLRGADFSGLELNPVATDGVVELVQERARRDQVMTNLYQGLRAASGTYAVRWVDP